MKEWSKIWLLQFHPDKLKHLQIFRRPTEEDQRHTYFVGEDKAKREGSEKDLGIHMDK